jgi:PAS domain S-box-containing protein
MDITERIHAEEALRESEEKFRGIAEGSFDMIFILNLEGEIMYISPVVERLLGYNPELLIGKNFIEYIPESELLKIETAQNKLIEGGGFEGLELLLRRKDGTLRYFETNINPIYKHDEPVGVQGIARDITERKHAEEEMKKQLMKFKLDEGEVYLVKERSPTLSIEAFKDLVKAGYNGLIISRTPEKHFINIIDENNEFLWLSEKRNHNTIPPDLNEIENKIETLSNRKIILLDRLDYLNTKYEFKDILTMVQHLKDLVVIQNHILLISFDANVFNSKEIKLLEKETKEIETVYKSKLPEHFFNILKYVYQQNVMGLKPSYTDIGIELEMSKPTVRKRVRELVTTGYLLEFEKGRNKIVELSSRGKNIFLK